MNKSELLEELRKLDELTLLELLDISAEDIVDNFYERINERIEYIYKELQT